MLVTSSDALIRFIFEKFACLSEFYGIYQQHVDHHKVLLNLEGADQNIVSIMKLGRYLLQKY